MSAGVAECERASHPLTALADSRIGPDTIERCPCGARSRYTLKGHDLRVRFLELELQNARNAVAGRETALEHARRERAAARVDQAP